MSIEFSNTRILRIHGNAIFGHGQPLRQPLFDGSAACVSQDRDGRPAQRASRRNDAARYQKHGPRSARSQLKTSLAFQAILNAGNRSTSRQMHGPDTFCQIWRDFAQFRLVRSIVGLIAANVILKRKGITPSNTLLHGAYDAMISTLKADRGAAFDRDYLKGQAEYQKGNAALFEQESQNGSDPDLDITQRRSPPFQ